MKTSIFINNTHPVKLLQRCLMLAAGCLLLMQGMAQSDKRLKMADQYYASGEYYTAAGLYGQFLQAAKQSKYQSDFPLNVHRNIGRIGHYESKTAILYKQAESYRLANYWAEAANLYKQCYEKDPVKYASALYWYAVCERSLGDYDKAIESLNKYLSNANDGSEFYAAAMKEKETLQFVTMQLKRPDSSMYHVQKMKTEFGDAGIFAPVSLNRDQFLFTSTQADHMTPGDNPYHNRLFTSTVYNNDVQTRDAVLFESIDSSMNQGAASMSADGNHLYLTQWKKENGQTISSIYYSNKTNKGWSQPQLLTSVNEAGHNSKQPFCSPDGQYLFFSSDRSGGKGGFDIWYAPILKDGTTGEAVNASPINSSANEQAPFYHTASGTLVFASDRSPGMGGYDLYSSKGSGTEWKAPENMGSPVNSSRDDIYFFTNQSGSLLEHAIISSDRGSECCLALYAVSKTEKKKMIAGVVMDCAINQPLDSTKVVLKDATGKTWETTTGPDGKYAFDITDISGQKQLVITRDNYMDKTSDIVIEKTNESNWRTDTLLNATSCVEKKFVLKVENVVTLYFDFDKSALKDKANEQLDSIYQVMVDNPTYRLQISGYTDSKGSVEYNNKLSERRAKTCADYLIKKGLAPARIAIHSFGAMFPVEMELINGRDNESGRAKNRRALINIDKE